ncbi:MAG TPA: hypothetical protein VKB50_16190 [Vicinamibacterales bacterium]|nr:hypothetical protein [Vicinamibacterales bacterium]
MTGFLLWVEQLSYSTWVRESPSLLAFPLFLFVHTLGMALVAGGSAVISFAILGMWPKSPLRPLERLFPVLWFGFWINLFTGVSIFMKDANAYGHNLDLYIKLIFVVIGLWLMAVIRKQVFGDPELDRKPISSRAKMLAWVSLGAWFCAIVAGRLIAYVGPVPGL